MNSSCLCPNLAGFFCHSWPDKSDESYPPLIQLRLSALAPALAQSVFENALSEATAISENIYIQDAAFWASLRRAQARCELLGIYSERLE